MTALPAKIPKAELPQRYEAAKAALERCVLVDECKEWADQSAAIASYARQSKDDALERLAVRIRARAIRRCGELLKAIEPSKGGQPTRGGDPLSRGAAADRAGLSRDQRRTALRVASVSEADFEAAVESDRPASIPQLAALGITRKPMKHRTEGEAEQFAVSTEGQAALGVLYRAAQTVDAKVVALGATKKERERIIKQGHECVKWIGQLIKVARRVK